MGLEVLVELLRRVLAAPIRIKYRLTLTLAGRAVARSHIDGIADQAGAHMVGHRIPDRFLGAAVQDRGQIGEPLPGSDVGDIVNPLHSRLIGGEVPVDQVRAGFQVGDGDRGTDFRPGLDGFQA